MTTLAGTSVGLLDAILATRVKQYYPHRVDFTPYNFPYDRLKEMTTWCNINCQGKWHSHTTHALYFQFEEDRDALMFTLKWR